MTTSIGLSWFPLFEFLEFRYSSFQVATQGEELMGLLGGPVSASLSAIGSVNFGQAMRASDQRYTVAGWVDLVGAGRLRLEVRGECGQASDAATFEATGTPEGELHPAYHLLGWVNAEQPIVNGAGRVLSICGSIRRVNAAPSERDAAVGAFTMNRA